MSNKGRGPIIGDVAPAVPLNLLAEPPGVRFDGNPGMSYLDPAQDLTDVLKATGIAVLVLNDDLIVRYFTPAIQDIYRLWAGDIGRPITEVAALCADSGLLVAVRQVLSGGTSADCDIKATEGGWFNRRIQPCVTAGDLQDGLVITFVDITRNRAERDQLATAVRCARLADAAKSDFLNLASHDLRQPLQTMFILQELLATSVTSQRDRDLVARLDGALGSMLRMIDRFSDFDQIDAVVPSAVSAPVSARDAPLPSQLAPQGTARVQIAEEDAVHLAKPVTVERSKSAVAHPSEADQPASALQRAANSVVASGALHPVAVHIVDDSSDFRQALRMLLESEGRFVCDYASCELFLAAYDPLMQGCVLLDAYLPGMGGLVLLDHLHTMDCKLPVVMITGRSDVAIAVAAMKGGAVDFLEKPVNAAEIGACIQRALTMIRPLRGDVSRDLREGLTPRQRQVLDGVLAGQASKTIAFDLGISQRTVESHRAALMDRVGARSVPELVRKVLVPT